MKYLVSFLVFLVVILPSQALYAANTAVNNVVSLGGFSTSPNLTIPSNNPDGYFTISMAGTTTGNHVWPFQKNGVIYQVTAGKTFQMSKICFASDLANTKNFQLISDTVTFAIDAAVGSLTAPVFEFGAAGGTIDVLSYATAAGSTYYCYDKTYSFGASTFPGIQSASTARTLHIYAVGREI